MTPYQFSVVVALLTLIYGQQRNFPTVPLIILSVGVGMLATFLSPP